MILAQTDTAAGGGSFLFIWIVVLVAMFYFLLIRPQRTRARRQAEMASSLELGDRVQTFGGIQGVIDSLDQDSVVLRLEDGRMRVSRRAIGAKLSEQD